MGIPLANVSNATIAFLPPSIGYALMAKWLTLKEKSQTTIPGTGFCGLKNFKMFAANMTQQNPACLSCLAPLLDKVSKNLKWLLGHPYETI
jgi:hypothetical protein